VEFDSVKVGQGVRIKLLRSRFQTKDVFIQSVGLFEGFAPAADKKEEAEADEDKIALQIEKPEGPEAEEEMPPLEKVVAEESKEAEEAKEAEEVKEAKAPSVIEVA
jgi:hypothetical protein